MVCRQFVNSWQNWDSGQAVSVNNSKLFATSLGQTMLIFVKNLLFGKFVLIYNFIAPNLTKKGEMGETNISCFLFDIYPRISPQYLNIVVINCIVNLYAVRIYFSR